MLLLLLLVAIDCSLARIPYICTEIRLETKHEAERRQIYEYCNEICDENESSSTVSCSECRIPYEGYGCLWQRNELEVNCAIDCDQLLPDRLAQMRCVEKCGITNSLNVL